MNSDFANFVREASFNLTLSQQMISAMLVADRDCNDPKIGYGLIYSRKTTNALYHRGLIIPTAKAVPDDWKSSPWWPYAYDLTEAGKLVVGLLKEAGFKSDNDTVAPSEETPEVKISLKDNAHV